MRPRAAATPSSSAHSWTEPALIFLDVRAGAGGSGNATFRWKTNQPNGNSQLYVGGLSNVASASVLGTWKLTARQNTLFTMTAPDGTSTDVSLDPGAAAQFAGPIRAYVGIQPNATANIGQGALIGGVKITQGTTVLLEDNFSGDTLDETKWAVNATAGGVQFLTPDQAGYFVTWGLPDTGFVLQWAPSLKPGTTWTDSTAVPINLGPLQRQVHVPKSELPPGNEGYFRLSKSPSAP